jgi:hypothetical protein
MKHDVQIKINVQNIIFKSIQYVMCIKLNFFFFFTEYWHKG